MKLPNAPAAVVAQEKVCDYLLNPAHPDNGGKAAFFLALGFSREQWPALAVALRKLAATTDVTEGLDHHMAESMFWTVGSRVQAAGRRSFGPSGLWTQDRMCRDWSRRIRVKNESEL